MKETYATIKDVAKAAGTSVTTASRALNGKPDISDETKKNILEAAEKLGYVRSSIALRTKSRLTKTVGVLFEADFDPFFSEVLKGIEAAARNANYSNILMNTELDEENERKAIKTLIGHRVDGIMVIPARPDPKYIKYLLDRKLPVVIIGRDYPELVADEIFTDDLKGGQLATEHLIRRNCRNLLMINSGIESSASRMREQGFLRAIEQAGDSIDYRIVRNSGYDNIGPLLKREFAKGSGIDGIFCFNDMQAIKVIKNLGSLGFDVPKDIRVLGYDDISFSSDCTPSLSTIRIDKFREGYEGFRMLRDRINGTHSQAKKTILDVELVIRESA